MLEIDKYQPSDNAELVALYANKKAFGGNFDAKRDTAARLEATAAQGNLYVARDDRRVVGSFMVLDNPHSFWLLRFVVEPEHAEGRQIAKMLFEQAIKIAGARGHSSVIVYTDSDDEQLNQRYKELGCHQADIYRCYWKETA